MPNKIRIVPDKRDQTKFKKTTVRLERFATITVPSLMEEAAKDGAEAARAKAPVKTGYLKAKIIAFKDTVRSWIIESPAPYSGYVEYGTRFIKPRHFFFQPIRRVINKINTRLRSALKQASR